MIKIKHNSIKSYIVNDVTNKVVTLPIEKEFIQDEYNLVYKLIGYNYDTVHYDKNVKYELQHVKDPLGIFHDDFEFCNVLLNGKVVKSFIQGFTAEDCVEEATQYKDTLEQLGLRLF